MAKAKARKGFTILAFTIYYLRGVDCKIKRANEDTKGEGKGKKGICYIEIIKYLVR